MSNKLECKDDSFYGILSYYILRFLYFKSVR